MDCCSRLQRCSLPVSEQHASSNALHLVQDAALKATVLPAAVLHAFLRPLTGAQAHDAAGGAAIGSAHLGDEEAAIGLAQERVGDGGLWGGRGGGREGAVVAGKNGRRDAVALSAVR